MSGTPLPLTRVTAGSTWFDLGLAELVEYRELIAFLIWRDVKVRYKQNHARGAVGVDSARVDHPERIAAALRGWVPSAARPDLYGDGHVVARVVESVCQLLGIAESRESEHLRRFR
jgi:hypothetical protein